MCWHHPAVGRICCMKAESGGEWGETGGDICRCLCGSGSDWLTSPESSTGCMWSPLTLNASWWCEKCLKNRNRGKEDVSRNPKTSERISFCQIYILYTLTCINMHLLYISLLFWCHIKIMKCGMFYHVHNLKCTCTHANLWDFLFFCFSPSSGDQDHRATFV